MFERNVGCFFLLLHFFGVLYLCVIFWDYEFPENMVSLKYKVYGGVRYLEKDLKYYMSLNYFKVVIWHENLKKYQVIYPQLPGCVGWADVEENIDLFSKALLSWWISTALSDDYAIPEP